MYRNPNGQTHSQTDIKMMLKKDLFSPFSCNSNELKIKIENSWENLTLGLRRFCNQFIIISFLNNFKKHYKLIICHLIYQLV